MGLFDQFPYTNFHELNLDWILKALKELEHTIEQFVAINALKYADPIQWNIISQYEKNTIVIDPLTGTAYISVQPVPSGVSLTNTDYWTVVFDLGQFVVKAAKNFCTRYEEATTLTATFSSSVNDWIIWGDTLYYALVNITAGDSYVVDSNIKQFTVEDVVGHIQDLNTTDKSNLVAAINEVLLTLQNTAGDLDNLTTTDKSNLVAAVNEVINNIGDLSELTTPATDNLVNAINSKESFKVATTAQVVIYIDGTNGDDDNDGLTNLTPVKTLDKALSFLNSVSSAIRFEFLTTGTYSCSMEVISGCFVHFKADAPNIIINFPSSSDITFYDSDFLVLDDINGGNNFIFNGHRILTVNAHCECYDVEFNMPFHLEGTNGQFTRCTFDKNCLFTDSYGLVVNSTFNATSADNNGFTFQHNSHGEFRGIMNYGADYYQQYYAVYVNDSEVVCNCNFTGETAPHTFRLERSKLTSAFSNMPTYVMVGANDIITDYNINSTHEAGLSNITPYYDGCNRIGMSIYLYHANFTVNSAVTTQKVATLSKAPILASFIPISSGSGDDGYLEITTSGEVIVHNVSTTGSKHAQGMLRILNPSNP